MRKYASEIFIVVFTPKFQSFLASTYEKCCKSDGRTFFNDALRFCRVEYFVVRLGRIFCS